MDLIMSRQFAVLGTETMETICVAWSCSSGFSDGTIMCGSQAKKI